jgi:hypothetical protein
VAEAHPAAWVEPLAAESPWSGRPRRHFPRPPRRLRSKPWDRRFRRGKSCRCAARLTRFP